jgi:uncharacterized membrane protein YecN with MAPEG domain
MELIVIVTALALAQYTFFGIQVGGLRGKHGVKAPAITGEPEFERMFRVHQNTMEQLVMFLPSLWMFGYYVDARWGAGIGLVYIVGRFIYSAGYRKDPAKRGLGMTVGYIATVVLLIGALSNVVRSLF